MKKRIPIICLLAGSAILATTLAMALQPWWAAWTSAGTLEELEERISSNSIGEERVSNMAVVEIGGYAYMGYLSIPEIGRELPVMSDWSDEKLKVSPCRYYGSIEAENLVLAAHNYPGFFGHLKDLSVGDSLYFTDAGGNTREYVVSEFDVLHPDEVEKMISSGYPLTLFTCTEDERDRLTVRCETAPGG